MQGRSDVVVIGAGLSGLAAAIKLVDAGVETVTVLEAGPRVGGRTLNGAAGGTTLDEGATLVYPEHRYVLGLAERFGVEVFESGGQGRFLYSFDGTARTFTFGRTRGVGLLTAPLLRPVVRGVLALLSRWKALPMPAGDIIELLSAIRQLDGLAASVPKADPWSAPQRRRTRSAHHRIMAGRSGGHAVRHGISSSRSSGTSRRPPRCCSRFIFSTPGAASAR